LGYAATAERRKRLRRYSCLDADKRATEKSTAVSAVSAVVSAVSSAVFAMSAAVSAVTSTDRRYRLYRNNCLYVDDSAVEGAGVRRNRFRLYDCLDATEAISWAYRSRCRDDLTATLNNRLSWLRLFRRVLALSIEHILHAVELPATKGTGSATVVTFFSGSSTYCQSSTCSSNLLGLPTADCPAVSLPPFVSVDCVG